MNTRRVLTAMSLILSASVIAYIAWERPFDQPDLIPPIEISTMPSPSASPSEGRDIGLSFRVCRATEVAGLDLGHGGSTSTAWTATMVRPNGRCTRSFEDSYVVAVDVDGDGHADASSKPLRYCFVCRPVAATDIDADGDGELLVLEQGGSVGSYLFYEIESKSDDTDIRATRVAPPGHPKARHPPGEPLRFWVGGDEGFAAAATCTRYPDDPLLVVEWSNHPIEGSGAETTELHRTVFRLQDGAFHVVDTTDTQESPNLDRRSGLERSRDVCGVNLSGSG
jgi:hypothetical protein